MMGHRLSKIATRTGDDGTTGLGDGSRIDKDHPRIEAIGDIDELNSSIGVILSHELPDEIRDCLNDIQQGLFEVGGECCIPGTAIINTNNISGLDQALDKFNATLPPLKEFIMPGGSPAAAHCHMARAICRRAERHLVGLNKHEHINPSTLIYINRLSDLLFVIARALARMTYKSEVQWQSGRQQVE